MENKIHLSKYAKLGKCKDEGKWIELTKMWRKNKKENTTKEKHLQFNSSLHCLLVGVSDEMASRGNSSSWGKTEEKRHQVVKEEGSVTVCEDAPVKNTKQKVVELSVM